LHYQRVITTADYGTLYNSRNEISGDGYYSMDVILALCYKSIGQINEAVAIMEGKLADSTTHPGLIDHLHLGVMLLELGDFQKCDKTS
jgi:hypothetical protein